MFRDTDSHANAERLASTTRRKLLAVLGVSGTSALAGCGGGDGGQENPTLTGTETPTRTLPPGMGGTATSTPTPTSTLTETEENRETETQTPTETTKNFSHVSGQTFKYPMGANPQEITFLSWAGALQEAVDTPLITPGAILNTMNEPTITGRWKHQAYYNSLGETFYRLFEDVEFTNQGNTIRITIRDDATWSDGQPVRAKDGAANAAMIRLISSPFERTNPRPWQALTNIRMPDGPDGKVYVLEDANGNLASKSKAVIFDRNLMRFWGIEGPTHIEPIKSTANAALENFRSAAQGDDWSTRAEIVRDNVETEDFERFRNPENVVSQGPWKLSEIRGSQEVVLKPNPHYWDADNVNFDQVIFTYNESQARQRAALGADRLDYAAQTLPPSVAEGLPNTYELINVPTNGGNSLGFDHSDPHLGNRNVRQAIQYALNMETIAQNVHPTATKPIDVPGGDMWARDAVVSDQWVENNLINYGTTAKTEQANQLMENVGYSQQGGTWVGPEGNELSYQLPTPSNTPRYETTVAQQLSNWGIETEVQTYDGATYQDKWDNGDFQVWPTPSARFLGFYPRASRFWRDITAYLPYAETWNIFPKEDIEQVEYMDNGWLTSAEEMKQYELKHPPIGEPDGPLQSFQPGYVVTKHGTPTIADKTETYKKYFWIANWMVPAVQINLSYNQIWIDTQHWNWPADHYLWDYIGLSHWPADLLSMNMINANPKNPEEGATAQ